MNDFLYFCGGLTFAALAFIAWTAGRDILRLRRIAREARKPDPTPFPIRPGWYCENERGEVWIKAFVPREQQPESKPSRGGSANRAASGLDDTIPFGPDRH